MTSGPTERQAHRLTGDELARLAAGHGSAETIASLEAVQVSRRKLLLIAVRHVLEGGRAGHEVTAAADILDAAGDRDPGSIRAVLLHPFLEVWAARILRGGPTSAHADIGYLQGLAAAAAIRSGIDAEVPVRLRGGRVLLATLGTVVAGDGHETGSATVTTGPCPGSASVRALGRDIRLAPGTADWLPRRTVIAAKGSVRATFAIEEADPYRDCYHLPAAGRLAAPEASELAERLVQAWDIVVARHPDHAAGVRACVKTLVPLAPPPAGAASAASRRAYGAVGLSLPSNPETLALLLLHEYEHVKLGALLDLVRLVEPGGRARHYAPWRADARPASALLQGVYAHLAVTEYWRRARFSGSPERAALALREFAYWRLEVERAARRLAESGELTEVGRAFVAGMMSAIAGWDDILPVEVEATARMRVRENGHAWARRHGLPVADIRPPGATEEINQN